MGCGLGARDNHYPICGPDPRLSLNPSGHVYPPPPPPPFVRLSVAFCTGWSVVGRTYVFTVLVYTRCFCSTPRFVSYVYCQRSSASGVSLRVGILRAVQALISSPMKLSSLSRRESGGMFSSVWSEHVKPQQYYIIRSSSFIRPWACLATPSFAIYGGTE